MHYDADVVFGSRFRGSGPKRIIYYTHQFANKILTLICSLLCNKNFSDIETGYKVIKKSVIDKIQFEQKDFGIEIELVMKLSKMDAKIYEVGINYHGRTYSDGKKVGLKDGIKAMYLIFYYFFK